MRTVIPIILYLLFLRWNWCTISCNTKYYTEKMAMTSNKKIKDHTACQINKIQNTKRKWTAYAIYKPYVSFGD